MAMGMSKPVRTLGRERLCGGNSQLFKQHRQDCCFSIAKPIEITVLCKSNANFVLRPHELAKKVREKVQVTL